jgi:CMP-N-acetylneuraminic acid synthetase
MNLAFVPARGGSKSIPLKNIKLLNYRPLIFWSLSALEKSKVIDKIYVSTDCKAIVDIVKGFNFEKVSIFNRSEESASDTASTELALLEFLYRENIHDDDYIFLVQATSPFTQSKDFDNAYDQLIRSKKDSLLTGVLSKRFFWDFKGKPINYNPKTRPRRQDFRGCVMENGAFYINKAGKIKRHKNRISGNIEIYLMSDVNSLEIDEKIDWEIASVLMSKHVK